MINVLTNFNETKRRININQLDFAFYLVFDNRIMIKKIGFQELQVVALDNKVLPIIVRNTFPLH